MCTNADLWLFQTVFTAGDTAGLLVVRSCCEELSNATASNDDNYQQQHSRRRQHVCPNNCGRVYKYKNGLQAHLKLECGKQPQFKCDVCSRMFSRNSTLKRHKLYVHWLTKLKLAAAMFSDAAGNPRRDRNAVLLTNYSEEMHQIFASNFLVSSGYCRQHRRIRTIFYFREKSNVSVARLLKTSIRRKSAVLF